MTFLLDEHISPEVAEIGNAGGDEFALPLSIWRDGAYLGQSDRHLLREAAGEGLVLVTFDLATIPVLLQELAIEGKNHAGVVFISSKSFAQNDSPGIAKALTNLRRLHGSQSWTNRVVFLSKSAGSG